MRIVVASDMYYPMINGVAVFAHNLAVGLAKRGHEVMVVAPSVSGEYEEKMEDGVRVVGLASIRMPLYPDQIEKVPEMTEIFGAKIPRLFYRNGIHVSWKPAVDIKRALADFRPDIIHNQTPGPVAIAILSYAKKNDIPLVSTGHAYPDNVTGQIRLLKPIKKPVDAVLRRYFASFLKNADYATMPTKIAIKDLMPGGSTKYGVRVEALSNGVDLSRFSPGKASADIYRRYEIAEERPTVVYVGRVDAEKSLDVLIRAFDEVRRKVKGAQLVIVGDGKDKSRLEEITEKLGLSQDVVFTGRVVGEDLPALYRVGDVFAITSETETQSIVLMEAMASGLPCVAVDAGAVRELVKNGKNGYLRRPGDIRGVARAITKILEDRAIAKRMGAESVEMVKRHDIARTLDRIEEIYGKVVG